MKAYSVSHESGDLLWKRDESGSVVKYKWELVGSHTSRRSAVTSLYNTGLLDAKDIMSISGHDSLKNFEGYIRRGAVEQAERIAAKMAKARELSLTKKEA
jgi:integrase